MTYISGYLLTVPDANRTAYMDMAAACWPIFKDYGALLTAECWGVDVPDGELTSFPMAVKREDGETVVFSWILWPDKSAYERCNASIETDERWAKMSPDTIPFDGKRMIWGGFEQNFAAGVPSGGLVMGFLRAAPDSNRTDCREWAEESWTILHDYGATGLFEGWGDEVPDGKLTSFPMAVKREGGEAVVFSWVAFPGRAELEAWTTSMETDARQKAMQNREAPWDLRRMMWGTFEPGFVAD